MVCRMILAGVMAMCLAQTSLAALQITEVMYDPNEPNDNRWEWIEVRNTDPNEVSLDGWLAFNLGSRELAAPTATVQSAHTTDFTIPGNSVAIIYDGFEQTNHPQNYAADVFRQAWGISPTTKVIAGDFFPQLANSNGNGKSIGFWKTLADYQADIVDDPNNADPNAPGIVGSYANAQFSLDFRTGFPSVPSPGGPSISWNGNGDNQNPFTWGISTMGQPGVVTSSQVQVIGTKNNTADIANPGIVPSGTFATAGLHITEIMYDPASTEPDWEWVEIYNNSGATVDLAGYILDDNNPTRSATTAAGNIASGSIPNNGTVILYNSLVSEADFKAAWGATLNVAAVSNWSTATMAFNNGADTIGLWDSFADYDPNGAAQDHVTHLNTVANQRYNDDEDFGTGLFQGPSLYLSNLSLDPNDGPNWVHAVDGDELSYNATAVTNPGGMVVFHGGGDIGSPGAFQVQTISDPDFDNDNDVDGFDFLIWQIGFGANGGNSAGDANGDGVVDGADLAIWESAYGAGGLQAVTAVPEPTSFVLCGLALAPWALRRRRG